MCWVLGARQCSGPGAVQARLSSVFWPWRACVVAPWSYTTLTLVASSILITAPRCYSLPPQLHCLHPRPGPAGQQPHMIVQHRLQSSEFVVAVLRSVVVKCCCDGRQPRHQDEGRDAGQGGHGQDLPGGEVPQWQVPGRGPGQVHHRGSLWRQVPLISLGIRAIRSGQSPCFRKLVIDGQSVLLGVWDTAGSERFESITRMYYRWVMHYFTIMHNAYYNSESH